MDKIEPALTPEEWKGPVVSSRDPAYVRPDRVPGYVAFDTNLVGDEPIVFPAEQVLAIANAALPDDSPYKISRADVRELRDLARYTRWDIANGEQTSCDPDELDRLAAKLAALLPPV